MSDTATRYGLGGLGGMEPSSLTGRHMPMAVNTVRRWAAPLATLCLRPGLSCVIFQRGRDAVADVSPTVRQRELGMRLRESRNAKGLTVEEVAEKLWCSATKISRAETGARRPTLRDVRDLCGIYGIGPETSAELMELARQAREPGWWTQYDDLKLAPFIGLEHEATAITCFGMYFVPALLQTGDYAREITKGIAPKIDANILGQLVEARLRRQKLLEGPKPTRYRALPDEAVCVARSGGQ